jgi:hemolysin activation/secretion protein
MDTRHLFPILDCALDRTRAGGTLRDVAHISISLCVLTASITASQNVHAQVRPDAGQTLESVRPAPTFPGSNPALVLPAQEEGRAFGAPSTLLIPVTRWRITGATAFSDVELRSLVDDRIGRKLTLDDLNAAAARITAYYRERGYLLARAYLPAQDIRNGEVEIAVLEGRLATVKIDNTSRVGASIISEHVERIDTSNPVQGEDLERSLLLLNDLPGVEVRSTLQPGDTVGTSDLDLRVRASRGIEGSVDADNYGNRYTGELRVGGTVSVNTPLGLGDVFTLRASTAGSGMIYGRAAWQTPLGGDGLQAGLAWSDLRYELGEDFESLEAQGDAKVGTLWVAYPIVRSQARNLSVRFAYDDKRLNDRIDAVSSNARKSLDVWTLGLSGDRSDMLGGGGLTTYRLDLVGGRLKLDPSNTAIDQSESGHDTEGSYGKLALNVSRLQRLNHQWLLYAALMGQASSKNLDTSERQSLGGIYGVRAYPQGEGLGDAAAIANLELRWQLPGLPDTQVLAFVDAGTVWVNHSALPSDGDNRRSVSGEGLGVQWLWPQSFALRAYVAWRSGPEPNSDKDRQPRFWMQLAQYF